VGVIGDGWLDLTTQAVHGKVHAGELDGFALLLLPVNEDAAVFALFL